MTDDLCITVFYRVSLKIILGLVSTFCPKDVFELIFTECLIFHVEKWTLMLVECLILYIATTHDV